jgi:hypothetical protein
MSANLTDRGTGRTARQMKAAPIGAVFVWCNDRLDYPKTLARAHWVNRPDLLIVGPQWLERGWIGQRFSGIVIDHATHLGERSLDLLNTAMTRIEVRQ